MKLGIIGLSGCGKTTIFEALTQNFSNGSLKGEDRIGTMQVPDPRIDDLSHLYQPKKTTYAHVEYFLPGSRATEADKNKENPIWNKIRDCDALIHVVRNFKTYGLEAANPTDDFTALDQELILADLVVVEKRLERLALDRKRGKNVSAEEESLLQACLQSLEDETPLRMHRDLARAPLLRGFAFVSAKPTLVLFNNEDDQDDLPPGFDDKQHAVKSMVLKGKLEQELAQMTEEEAQEFLEEFDISASARDRVLKGSYELLGLISFFTVGEDEVRAWTIEVDTVAQDAADVIHSDMKKGFIRAEVLAYSDLKENGSYAAARKSGKVRLEGKTYPVVDGDIIHFRFNV
jgi:GTP-binding protein YchF